MSKKKNVIPSPYNRRIAALRTTLAQKNLDCYLILNRMDQYWLTGFTGEDGLTLVTQRAVVLLTDGRFDEAADIQAPYATKILRKQRTPEANAAIIKRFQPKCVGFDPDQMSVADHAALKKYVKPIKLVAAGGLVTSMRSGKDAREIKATQKAIDVAQKAFSRVLKWIRPGRTERETAARLEYELRMLGAQGPSFPTIVAFGKNSSLPHYEPGDVVLKDKDLILIDWGAQVDWYTSDLTRMIWPAKSPRKMVEINRIVHEAHDRAIAAARPGITAHELDQVARKHIVKAGYGKCFNHALGHGIGLDVHEAPRVGQGTKTVLEPGMIITIEPGIYFPASAAYGLRTTS